jgi:hypothetical protein
VCRKARQAVSISHRSWQGRTRAAAG